MRLSLLLLVGCAGAAQPAVLMNRAPTPPKPACTEALTAEVAEELAAQWRIAERIEVRCIAGWFPEPGFYVAGTAHQAGLRASGVLAANGRERLVAFDREAPQDGARVVDITAADLDGDGVDEILESWRAGIDPTVRGSDSWVIVRRRAGPRLQRIEGPHLSVSHPNLGACTATSEVAGAELVIHVATARGIPPSACLAEGKHTFRLRKNALVGAQAR